MARYVGVRWGLVMARSGRLGGARPGVASCVELR